MGGNWTGRTWLALVVGTSATAAVVAMSWIDVDARKPVFGLATIGLAGAVAVLAFTWFLVRIGARSGESSSDATAVRPSYRHVVRLVAVLVPLVAVAGIARALLVPDTYGEFGYYRGNAAREAMTVARPLYQGRAVCAGCHAAEGGAHAKDVHGTVECETCHGPGAEHVASFEEAGASPVPIAMPSTREPCLWCHRRLAARPTSFPQIDPVEHYAFLRVTDPSTPCFRCHNPHEPLFLDKPMREARLHPVIQACDDCHAQPASAARPDDHPVVFECTYCHSEIAADFATRAHSALECGRCHLYHHESETAGRIVRNRDPRFCLLCHRANAFRGEGAPPLIEWPPHPNKEGPGIEGVVCVDCHLDKIHRHTADLRRDAAGGAR